MLNNKFTYIYVLKDPRDLAIRYVGKSDNPKKRLSTGHLSDKSNCPRVSWIKSLKKQGLRPIEEVIDKVLDNEWEEKEIYWINHYKEKGYNLVNWAKGGKGGSGMTGRTHSMATRLKQSNWRKGIVDSEETKKMKAKAKLGNKNAVGPRECQQGSKHKSFIDKPVEQIDRYTNQIIKVWSSAYEAARFYKQKWSSEIHFCCRTGKIRLGYKWKYQETI